MCVWGVGVVWEQEVGNPTMAARPGKGDPRSPRSNEDTEAVAAPAQNPVCAPAPGQE